ncbi:uncharacterized protein HKW66_Vig0146610 [Vigna angularis]|uniref:Uncharacterized protein n=1 Tax=Phaseolus angularis TaxID=3914 RepID=A0A8T0KF50_PHAAN|nr:uncharacterized protein HKW66_Vig0146610 [Vigna angularis]
MLPHDIVLPNGTILPRGVKKNEVLMSWVEEEHDRRRIEVEDGDGHGLVVVKVAKKKKVFGCSFRKEERGFALTWLGGGVRLSTRDIPRSFMMMLGIRGDDVFKYIVDKDNIDDMVMI